MGKSKDNIREGLVVAIVVVWLIGLLLLPDGILTDYYDYVFGDSYLYDQINPILGFMYVSPGVFFIPYFFFGLLFGKEKGITPKLTLTFYIGITVVFVVFSIKKTEFLLSAIALALVMIAATYLIKTDDVKQNCPTVK